MTTTYHAGNGVTLCQDYSHAGRQRRTLEACALSLFAGYGGLDLALEQVLGVSPLYVADIEAGPRKVLAFRYPDAPNLGDVTAVDWRRLFGVRVISGGSPCQDISHAGKRAGMSEGTRSNLWVAMREAIAVIRPELVIWENVNAARSTRADSALECLEGCVGTDKRTRKPDPTLRALGRVLGDLASLGYDAEWLTVPASDVGAAHLRKRVFVIAWPAGFPSNPAWVGHAANAWRVRRGQGGTSGPRETKGGRPLGEPAGRGVGAALSLLPTPAVNDMGAGKDVDAWTDKMRAAHNNGNGHGKSLDIEVRRLLPTPKANDNHCSSPADLERHDPGLRALPQMLPTPRATDGTKGGPNQRGTSGDLMLPSAVQPERWGVYAEAIARAEQVFGPAPHPVETAADGIGYVHTCATGGSNRAPKDGARRLSCRFDEWLMGLPAGWVTDVPEVTHAEALKMLGNGVFPAQAAAAIAAAIAACLSRAC